MSSVKSAADDALPTLGSVSGAQVGVAIMIIVLRPQAGLVLSTAWMLPV